MNALRYYDSKGLLHPTVRNPEGRKEWLYDDEAVRRAKRILLLFIDELSADKEVKNDLLDKMFETICHDK